MAITAQMVKELREKNWRRYVMDSKALTETNGDMEKAIDFLREKSVIASSLKSRPHRC